MKIVKNYFKKETISVFDKIAALVTRIASQH